MTIEEAQARILELEKSITEKDTETEKVKSDLEGLKKVNEGLVAEKEEIRKHNNYLFSQISVPHETGKKEDKKEEVVSISDIVNSFL